MAPLSRGILEKSLALPQASYSNLPCPLRRTRQPAPPALTDISPLRPGLLARRRVRQQQAPDPEFQWSEIAAFWSGAPDAVTSPDPGGYRPSRSDQEER